MSVATSITISQDTATPAIAAKIAKCSPARLGKVLGQPLATFFRVHLKSNPRNKRGWPSTGFWEEAADSVQFIPQENGVILRADKQGLRQRWKGGPISPQKGKAIAFAISPASYGKFPRDFPGLFLVKTKRGAYLCRHLGEFSGKTGRLKKDRAGGNITRRHQTLGLEFLFKLSFGLNQTGNPDVIPSEDQFAEVAMAAVERSVQ